MSLPFNVSNIYGNNNSNNAKPCCVLKENVSINITDLHSELSISIPSGIMYLIPFTNPTFLSKFVVVAAFT